uniref:LRIM1 n=1 Tax=Anopheles coluzzii TaxID=1518534 RepID=A0A0D3QDK5_ANOCL|nr:LRIM1 [Anopheles coluzzii]
MMSLQACQVVLLLVCVTATVHGAIHEIKQNGNRYKIKKVTDSSLKQALASLRQSAWNVKELDLSGNPLSQISAADLAPFTKLELLNLSSNVLYETLDLESLSTLRTLDLNNNYVQELLVGPSIETLHAANNNISRVSCSRGQGKKNIYLANNKITVLRDLDEGCRSRVQYLDLKLNEIDTVNLAELAASSDTLEHLNLQYNFIYDIQGQVVFAKLKTLDLSSNKLAFMGLEFQSAAGVTWISLRNNKLVLIEKALRFSQNLEHFDLRGNGFHCGTLRDFFSKNQRVQTVAKQTVKKLTGQNEEECTVPTHNHYGPYCCEDLPAPFAYRLIALKRKEHALLSGQGSETERLECERENQARQREIDGLKEQYRTVIDQVTLRKQAKITLEQKKKALDVQVSYGRRAHAELDGTLKQAVGQIELPHATEEQSPLQLLRAIVKRYEEMYVEQQSAQNNAIRDWDMYQHKETQLAEENARLKKLNGEADLAVASANATLQELLVREQNLATQLG